MTAKWLPAGMNAGTLTPPSARHEAMRVFDSMGFGPQWRGVVTDSVNGDVELRLSIVRYDNQDVERRMCLPRAAAAFTMSAYNAWRDMKADHVGNFARKGWVQHG